MNITPLMKTREVAKLLNVSNRTVEGWRGRNNELAYIRLPNGRIRYEREKVLMFLYKYRSQTFCSECER